MKLERLETVHVFIAKMEVETENKVLIVIFVLTVILKVLHLYLLSKTFFFFILINAGLTKLPVFEDLECGLLGGNQLRTQRPHNCITY